MLRSRESQQQRQPLWTVRGEGRYVRQTGGPGMYGHCVLEVGPLERGAGFRFASALVGGTIPAAFVPAVEDGVRDAMGRGVIAGYPVVDVTVTLVDGSFHPKDSNASSFRLAGALAFRDACGKCEMGLLEPVADVEVVAPGAFVGALAGDLARRRGQVTRQEARPNGDIALGGVAPLAEMFGYATALRSLTQGRAAFTLRPSGYEFVPDAAAQAILAARP